MKKLSIFMFLLGCLFLYSTASLAQHPVIDSEQLKSLVKGKQKAFLIDARPAEEYQQGHIPGAINISADRIKAEAARLPRDKTKAVIIYCRGVG